MSDYTYHLDEAVIRVPEGFLDRTMNVLEWVTPEGERVVLVIQRELSPALDEYVEQQIAEYPSRFSGYRLVTAQKRGDGPPAIELAIRSRSDAGAMHHQQLFITIEQGVLIATATGKVAAADMCEKLIAELYASFQVREAAP